VIILAAVLALVAVTAGAGLAEAMYGGDPVCARCGEIMPAAGHVCSEGR
jgi:hypothetical protein